MINGSTTSKIRESRCHQSADPPMNSSSTITNTYFSPTLHSHGDIAYQHVRRYHGISDKFLPTFSSTASTMPAGQSTNQKSIKPFSLHITIRRKNGKLSDQTHRGILKIEESSQKRHPRSESRITDISGLDNNPGCIVLRYVFGFGACMPRDSNLLVLTRFHGHVVQVFRNSANTESRKTRPLPGMIFGTVTRLESVRLVERYLNIKLNFMLNFSNHINTTRVKQPLNLQPIHECIEIRSNAVYIHLFT